ncbi:MAG: hypothetical protein PHE55_12480 [Methylococcaceae bacterium]|nr:hypothetical protein [Methylococcaceae bacterium]
MLKKALSLAQSKAATMEPIILEILKSGEVDGLCKLRPKFSTICFEAKKYNCTWVMSLPWSALLDTTPDEEATYILETVITNLQMEEAKSWPNKRGNAESHGNPS